MQQHNAECNKPKYLPLIVRHQFSPPDTYLPHTHTELSSHQFYLQPVDGRSYLKRENSTTGSFSLRTPRLTPVEILYAAQLTMQTAATAY